MGRAIKGHVEHRGGRWQVQATDASGKRGWHDLPATIRPEQHELAQQVGTAFAKKLRAGEFVPNERDLTVSEYFTRWNEARATRYPKQAKSDESAFRLWIADELGALPIRAVTRERLIEFSHHLDTIAAKGEDFGEKRARNIFSVVASMFRDAHASKDGALRVLETNPMADVPWPERSSTRALKQMLFPRELLALVSCPLVPLVRARLYAVTLYTTTRAAEVRVFRCEHFDLAHGSVQVVMSDDPTTRKATGAAATKSTKSGKARLASLEPMLSPVVAAMVEELGGVGRLFPDRPRDVPKGNQWRPAVTEYIPGPDGEYGLCGTFKRDLRAALEWAGIPVRPELFDDSDRRASLSIRFHDLRASGITWRHARRDNPAAILQECGHEDQATNEIYIRALRGLASADLFPALPERLLGDSRGKSPGIAQLPRNHPRNTVNLVGAEGFEPPTSTV
jgi:integrase